MKRALVAGAGGFIGGHLVNRLKADGYWVRGVDLKYPEFTVTSADDFRVLDLRDREQCTKAVSGDNVLFDEVYQLAADMGGMGFIHSSECEIMRNSALVNLNMIDAAANAGVPRYFYSSSVCIYRDMVAGEPALMEADAYPALPDNEYGWEKLYAERVALAYGRRFGIAVRIARFQNCYGPNGTWEGGREKAPAALCRKIAEVDDGGTIEVWGDGKAVRLFIYVDDLVDAVVRLTASTTETPTNIGTHEYVTIKDFVDIIADVADKSVQIRWVDGPVGVQSRNFSNDAIEAIGWAPKYSLHDGIAATYPWIAEQVKRKFQEPVVAR
jgi:GDP-D-mannose 3',5'-epimerase